MDILSLHIPQKDAGMNKQEKIIMTIGAIIFVVFTILIFTWK